MDAAADLGLKLAGPTNLGPTHFPRDQDKNPSMIDLAFMQSVLAIDHRPTILLDAMAPSDHAPLCITLPITEARIDI